METMLPKIPVIPEWRLKSTFNFTETVNERKW